MSRFNILTSITALSLSLIGTADVSAQFTISGTVTNPTTQPVANVDVFLYDDQGNPLGIPQTETDSNGFYSIANLPAATYGLEFQPTKASKLLIEFVSPVAVDGNETVNISLELGNALTGFVRDSAGTGIFNLDLNVYIQPEDTVINTVGDNTDLTGYYFVVVPDGIFRIRYRAVGGEKLVPEELLDVAISNDTAIDITMQYGFYISGSVVDSLDQPIVNADLDFINSSTGELAVTPADNTDNSGEFLVLIPNGFFDIQVEPLFANGLVPLEVLSVPIYKDSSMDFVLSPGVILSGTVSGPARAPVPDVDIDVIRTATGAKIFTPQDNTDENGQYQLLVNPGMYDIVAKPPVATRLAPAMTDSVTVNSATVVNFSVPGGFLVTGNVKNGNFAAVQNVDIDAKVVPSGQNVFLVGDNSDAAGNFGVVMVGGTYRIEIEPPFSRRLTAEITNSLLISGDVNLNFVLDTGILINGTVTDSAFVPVANVDVSAIINSGGDTVFTPLDNTGLSGTYQILVPPGLCKLVYIPEPPAAINDTVELTNVNIVRDTTINASFSSGQSSCCIGNRGDVNNDGTNSNILDLNYLVNRVFRGGPAAPCPAEADLNHDGTTSNIIDLNFLVNRIFRGGPLPGAC